MSLDDARNPSYVWQKLHQEPHCTLVDCEKHDISGYLSGCRQNGDVWTCPSCSTIWTYRADGARSGFWVSDRFLQAVHSAKADDCRWTEDEITGAWETSCGNLFQITTGTPADNGMRFCPYCGRTLKEGS